MIDWRDSVTYMAIVQEGEANGFRRGYVRGLLKGYGESLLRAGEVRFGKLSEEVIEGLNLETSIDRLRFMISRVWDIDSWNEIVEDVN